MQFKFFRNCLCILLIAEVVFSQWSTDPKVNSVINAEYAAQIFPFACTDMKDGAIVIWQEKGIDIYAQRIDRNGYLKWNSVGIPICTAHNVQQPIKLISNGYGGAILIWQDYRDLPDPPTQSTFSNTLFVQKIDSNGVVQWQTNGIQLSDFRISDVYGAQFQTTGENLETDQRGGAYISWSLTNDSLRALYSAEINVQHIDSSGSKLWSEWGTTVYESVHEPFLISDDSTGIYLLVGGSIAHRYSYDGVMLWDSTTFTNCGFVNNIIKDGVGGFIIAGLKTNPKRIRAHRVDRHGNKLWGDEHELYYQEGGYGDYILYYSVKTYSDYHGGAYIAWRERHDSTTFTTYSQHTLRVNGNGSILWADSGENCTPSITDKFGYIYDFYSDIDTSYRTYVKKIDKDGNLLWGEKGILFKIRKTVNEGFAGYLKSVPDNEGGIMMFWTEEDHLTSYFDIMGQLVNSEGQLGRNTNSVHYYTYNPGTYELLYNYPNPFNLSTTIVYHVNNISDIELNIYDLIGNIVFSEKYKKQQIGEHEYIWFGKDQYGNSIPSGIYICRINSGGTKRQTTKILLI